MSEVRPKKSKFSRKTIQIAKTEYGPLFALCDDGTIWYAFDDYIGDNIDWISIPSIPQEEIK